MHALPEVRGILRPSPLDAQELAAAQPVLAVLLDMAGRATAIAAAHPCAARTLGKPEGVDEAINRRREARTETLEKLRASRNRIDRAVFRIRAKGRRVPASGGRHAGNAVGRGESGASAGAVGADQAGSCAERYGRDLTLRPRLTYDAGGEEKAEKADRRGGGLADPPARRAACGVPSPPLRIPVAQAARCRPMRTGQKSYTRGGEFW